MSSNEPKPSSAEHLSAEFQSFVGFSPIWGEEASVLVLGSMPSVRSAEIGQYYGHAQNLFWRMMGEVYGFDANLPYAARVEKLCEARVALWDVAKLCLRKKSSDASMREVVPNDFEGFLQRSPKLDRLLFNGGKAQDLFQRLVLPKLRWPRAPLPMMRLPSTSPAFAAMTPAQKIALWRQALLGSPPSCSPTFP